MLNKTNVVLALVIVIMGALLVMRRNEGRRAQPAQNAVARGAPQEVAGVALPGSAADYQSVQISRADYSPGSQAGDPQRAAELPPRSPVPEMIIGPSKMPKDKCIAAYREYPEYVAAYSKELGGNSALDYSVCRSIAGSNEANCVFTQPPGNCVRDGRSYKMIYSAAIGKMDMWGCVEYFKMAKAGPKGWAPDRICSSIAEIVAGRAKPPAEFADVFRYLSGSSACAGLEVHDKRDCILLADVMEGVKRGQGRLWLYDALSGRGCAKAGEALVEKYCSNQLVAASKTKKKD